MSRVNTLAVLREAGFTPAELVELATTLARPAKGRRFSAKTRRRMALAQKARWAKAKKVAA